MTLDEYMSHASGIVAVGASSAYLFVGTRDQYESEIDKIYARIQSYAREQKRDAEHTLDALRRSGMTPLEITPYIPETDDLTELKGIFAAYQLDAERAERYAKALRTYATRYESYAKQKARAERMIKAEPFRVREVKDTYVSLTENKTCVIIEGEETGRYWDHAEAERSRK